MQYKEEIVRYNIADTM